VWVYLPVIIVAISTLVALKVVILAWGQLADDLGIETRSCAAVDFAACVNDGAPLGCG
jgi:hypothetical protein